MLSNASNDFGGVVSASGGSLVWLILGLTLGTIGVRMTSRCQCWSFGWDGYDRWVYDCYQ